MWSTTCTGTTAAAPEAVWAALEAMLRGVPIGPDGDTFELHGPFAVGSSLTVTPRGQEPMTSVVAELVPGERYADRTTFGDLVLTFRHVLRPTAGGGAAVDHTVDIDGPGADALGPELGPQISADFPEAMSSPLAAAERGVRA